MHLEKNSLKAKPTCLISELKAVQVGVVNIYKQSERWYYYIVVHSYNLIVSFQNIRICRKISVEGQAA